MGFGRGLLLWLIGIPLPIIIVLALFMHQLKVEHVGRAVLASLGRIRAQPWRLQ
jgi:hypothetical protein